MLPEAPFGVYVPPGMATPDLAHSGLADLPDREHIWSGQSLVMLVREG